jgi:hypothetical protein
MEFAEIISATIVLGLFLFILYLFGLIEAPILMIQYIGLKLVKAWLQSGVYAFRNLAQPTWDWAKRKGPIYLFLASPLILIGIAWAELVLFTTGAWNWLIKWGGKIRNMR